MERREFIKTVPLAALGAGVAAQTANAQDASSPARKVTQQAAGSQKQKLPDYAGKIGYSDMTATDADGKP